MRKRKIDFAEALELGQKLPYAWVRSLSSVSMGKNHFTKEQLEEMEEARLFDSETEVRLIRAGEQIQAWQIEIGADDRIITHSYAVRNPEFGGEIQVSQILDSDEDGQTYICDEKLSGWEENETWREVNQ